MLVASVACLPATGDLDQVVYHDLQFTSLQLGGFPEVSP